MAAGREAAAPSEQQRGLGDCVPDAALIRAKDTAVVATVVAVFAFAGAPGTVAAATLAIRAAAFAVAVPASVGGTGADDPVAAAAAHAAMSARTALGAVDDEATEVGARAQRGDRAVADGGAETAGAVAPAAVGVVSAEAVGYSEGTAAARRERHAASTASV